MNHEEFLELSAGHALHALSPDDEQRFTQTIVAHPGWADDARVDAEIAALLGSAVAPVTPSAQLRERIFDQIDRETGHTETVAVQRQPSRESVARRGWFALAASLVILLVVGGVGTFVAKQFMGPAASDSALTQIQRQSDDRTATASVTGGGTATIHWSDSLGKAVLVTAGMPSIPSNKVFELWYVRNGIPTSAGTFTARNGAATAPLTGSMQAGDLVAVTVEMHGGSATGVPTSTPITAIHTS